MAGKRAAYERLPQRTRIEARRLLAAGMIGSDVAAAVGCSPSMIYKLVYRHGRKPPRRHNPLRLSLDEREEISRGLRAGDTLRAIARCLGRNPSTISREVNANGGRDEYRAWRAEERAEECGMRPRPRKLEDERLRAAVEAGLEQEWSPEQISNRLRGEFPDRPEMNVSHETIYKSLFVQGRGTLRKELTRCLRTGRTERIARSRLVRHSTIPNLVPISERPPEVEDRAVPGHWEGDLIVGPGNRSAIGTLVERKSRFVMLLHLPEGKTAEHVREALTRKIQTLPEHVRRTLTWDRGTELAQHAQFTVDTGVKVYFCDPHSPWQRGSNENTNGLLRQYFPKGTDLAQFSEVELDRVAHRLNGRPRQTLGWKKPCEVLDELLR